jgi:phosphatidylserine decarboxylase
MRTLDTLDLLRLLPRNALSRAVGGLTRAPVPAAVHRAAIRAFASFYGVDGAESERPVETYLTFSEFFARRLKPGARPIAPGDAVPVSPADGRVLNFGIAERGELIQAKGILYTVADLLRDEEAARAYEGGAYATIYLAPKNYHRVHAPLGGEVTGFGYVPGTLWPVNDKGVARVERLFCLNERLATHLATPAGRACVVMVGATMVGRIRALYDDVLTNDGETVPRRERYDRGVKVNKGEEIGVFEMGSTAVVLFEPGRVKLDMVEGREVRVGEAIGGPA